MTIAVLVLGARILRNARLMALFGLSLAAILFSAFALGICAFSIGDRLLAFGSRVFLLRHCIFALSGGFFGLFGALKRRQLLPLRKQPELRAGKLFPRQQCLCHTLQQLAVLFQQLARPLQLSLYYVVYGIVRADQLSEKDFCAEKSRPMNTSLPSPRYMGPI